ncbi:MAG: hypothetical protein RJB65_1479 [Actinomycetota bacterium]
MSGSGNAAFGRIAVVMAMHDEATPVIAALGAQSVAHHGQHLHDWFEATLPGNAEVLIAVNAVDPALGVAGVGPEPAVMTTLHVVEHWRPDIVVSAGTAGGWAAKGGEIGKAYLAGPVVVRHDRRIDIPGYTEYAIGSYPCHPLDDVAAVLGLTSGVVSSGGSLDENADDRRMIDATGAVAKDMEATSVAQVCALHGVAFTGLKVLTDLHDAPATTADQFQANLASASEALAVHLVRLVAALAGDPDR